MKAKINNVEIEGTPDEFREFFQKRQLETTAPTEKRSYVRHGRYKKKKPKQFRKYEPEEIRLAWKMNTEGSGYKQIAKKLGRTKQGIENLLWRIRHGLIKMDKV